MRLLTVTSTALALAIGAPAIGSTTPAAPGAFEASLLMLPAALPEPNTLSALLLGLLGLMGIALIGSRPRPAGGAPVALAQATAAPEPLQS